MKRTTIYLIIILAAAAAYRYSDRILFYTNKIGKITQTVSQSGTLQDVKKEIYAPAPLRGTQDAPDASLTRAGTIQFTNLQRAQNGQKALAENSLLNQAAQNKLDDMFKNQYFEHESPDHKGPGDLAEAVHYEYIAVGENLALGNFENDQILVEAWMNSPGHRANILNDKFTEIGVAAGKGKFEGRTVWMAVQEFGKPASACPTVNAGLNESIQSYKSELNWLETEIIRQKAGLEAADPKSQADYNNYNREVKDYNSLVKMYNNKLDVLKSLIADYNRQVNSYNQCLNQ